MGVGLETVILAFYQQFAQAGLEPEQVDLEKSEMTRLIGVVVGGGGVVVVVVVVGGFLIGWRWRPD